MPVELDLDPASWEFRHNAIDIYRRLLEEQPVALLAGGRYLICRHADVSWALKNHDAVLRPTEWSSNRKPEGPFRDFGRSNMIGMNPPDHTRFRRSIMRAFAPRRIAELEAFVARTCDSLIDRMQEKGAGDFVDDFAYPLPVAVVCEMLGLPEADLELLRTGSHAMLAGLEISASAEELAQAGTAAGELFAYLRDIVDQRARNLGDDLFSLLIHHQQEDHLSRDEVVWAAITLLIAGHETTTHLLGNGLLALIRNPGQFQRLVDEPGLVGNAVEEFLRYDPSLYMLFRQTVQPVELSGVAIPQGAFLMLSLAGANRDPRVFARPDELQIDRANAAEHLTFAAGRHLCAGHAVARLEARIAFARLTSRFSGFELQGEPQPRDGLMFAGYHSLPVRYSAWE